MARLRSGGRSKPDYWDFRETEESLASKTLFQYPAMMVPALQKQIILAVLRSRPNVRTVADAFLGSGTILALSMLMGQSFVGQDINPLAILISKTRAFSLNHDALSEAVTRVNNAASADRSREYAASFERQSKWFTSGASIGLSCLRRAILAETEVTTRRFLWVCLAETVRLNSNSRTSTYKLHVRPPEERTASRDDVLGSFSSIAAKNLSIVSDFANKLASADCLDANGDYIHHVNICYGDSTKGFPRVAWEEDGKFDLMVTSPPYGDNRTTVPYGQASWLPLQWIDLQDIDPSIPASVVDGAYNIDNDSLGGRRERMLVVRVKELNDSSPRAKAYIKKLKKLSRDGLSRFVNFTYDLKLAVAQICGSARHDGHVVLTLGNRNIAKTVCPLSDICAELFAKHNGSEIIRIVRKIPSKRMPGKNGHSSTINHEYISVLHLVESVGS